MGMGDPTQPISASPARPPPPNPPKSAFDDLEDAMRMSLGGSPARSAPITQQPQPMTQPFGDVMMSQPMMFGSPARQPMMPMTMGQQQPPQPNKVLTGDLDSSLAQLANNLTINKAAPKTMQWSPKSACKPGGAWSPQPMQATTGAGYRPMQQPPMVMGMNAPMMPMGSMPMRPSIPPTTNQFS